MDIRLPNGLVIRGVPDGTTKTQLRDRLSRQGYDLGELGLLPPADVAPSEPAVNQSLFRSAADLPVQFGMGIASGIRSVTDVFGANNPVSQNIRGVEDYLDGLLSAQAKLDQQEVAAIWQEAQDKGFGEQVMAGLKAMAVSPLDFMANAAGTVVPTALGGVAGAALKSIAGLAPAAAATARAAAAAKGAGAVGALMGAGITKQSIYEAVKEQLTASRPDLSPEEIEAKAQEAQSYTGQNLDNILLGAGLGAVAGGYGVESALFKTLGKEAAKKKFQSALFAGLKEGVPEFVQAGHEQFAGNIAAQREGFDVPTMRGLGIASTLEGVLGFGLGAAVDVALPERALEDFKNVRADITNVADRAKEEELRKNEEENRLRFLQSLEEENARRLKGLDADIDMEAEAAQYRSQASRIPFPTDEEMKLGGRFDEIAKSFRNKEDAEEKTSFLFGKVYGQKIAKTLGDFFPNAEQFSIATGATVRDEAGNTSPSYFVVDSKGTPYTAPLSSQKQALYTAAQLNNEVTNQNVRGAILNSIETSANAYDPETSKRLFSWGYRALHPDSTTFTALAVNEAAGTIGPNYAEALSWRKIEKLPKVTIKAGKNKGKEVYKYDFLANNGQQATRYIHGLTKSQQINKQRSELGKGETSRFGLDEVRGTLSPEELTNITKEFPPGVQELPAVPLPTLRTVHLNPYMNDLLKSKNITSRVDSDEIKALIKAFTGKDSLRSLDYGELRVLIKQLGSLPRFENPTRLPSFEFKPYTRENVAKTSRFVQRANARGIEPDTNEIAEAAGFSKEDPRLQERVQQVLDHLKKQGIENKSKKPLALPAPAVNDPDLDSLRESLRKKLTGFGLKDIGLSVGRTLIHPTTREQMSSEGLFYDRLKKIFLSLDAVDPDGSKTQEQRLSALAEIMDHEIIHAVRAMDLWTDAEWETLKKAVASYKKAGMNYSYLDVARVNYQDQNSEIQFEEAVADMFRDYAAGRLKIGGKPRALLERLAQFFKKIREALGATKFDTYQDVFDRLMSGEVGARERGQIRTPMLLEQQQAQEQFNRREAAKKNPEAEGKKQVGQEAPVAQKAAITGDFDVRSRFKATQDIRESRALRDPVALSIMVDGRPESTRDSEGRLIYSGPEGIWLGVDAVPTEEGIRNFWKWFKNSKAIDRMGRPLVFYHGTATDILAFRPKQAGSVFMTRDSGFAEEFTQHGIGYLLTHSPEFMEAPAVLEMLNELLVDGAFLVPAEREVKRLKKDVEKAVKAGQPLNGATIAALEANNLLVGSSSNAKIIERYLPSNANIIPLYASVQNPFDYQNRSHVREVVARASQVSGRPFKDSSIDDISSGDWIAIEGKGEESPVLAAIKDLGFDGMYVAESGHKNLAVFDPSQVKSAIGNNGMFGPSPSIRESRKITPEGFYSALEDQIEELNIRSTTPSGWKNAIKGLVNSGKVKQEEVEWSGVNDLLDTWPEDKKYTKQGLLADLSVSNPYEVETIVKTEALSAEDLDMINKYGGPAYKDAEKAAYQRFDHLSEHPEMFRAYSLSTRLPEDLLRAAYNRLKRRPQYKEFVSGDPNNYSYEEVLLLQKDGGKNKFISEHWDEPNVISHYRSSQRLILSDSGNGQTYIKDEYGAPKTALFIEEVQSDWAQRGRELGFKEEADSNEDLSNKSKRIRDERSRAVSALEELYRYQSKNLSQEEYELTLKDIDQYENMIESFDKSLVEIASRMHRPVPAPYVKNTDSWLNLTLKKIIIDAIQKDHDAVAFAGGKANAKRWQQLEKITTNKIEVYPLSKSQKEFIADEERKRGKKTKNVDSLFNVVLHDAFIEDESRIAEEVDYDWVREKLGKRVADGVRDIFLAGLDDGNDTSLEWEPSETGDGVYIYTPTETVEFGGEGMIDFYDNIIPAAANKILQKIGGERVRQINLSELRNPVLGFDITEKMKEKVSQGLQYFGRESRGINVEAAPDPRNEEAMAAWNAMSEADKANVTKYVGDVVIPAVMSSLQVEADDYFVEYTLGGFVGETQPSVFVGFSDQVPFENIVEASKVLGILWKQQAVIAFDENDSANGSQTQYVKLTPSRPLSYEEQSDLFKRINALYPSAAGFSSYDGSLVFGNFTAFDENPVSPEDFHNGINNTLTNIQTDYDIVGSNYQFRSEYLDNLSLEGTKYESDVETTPARGKMLRGPRDFDSLQSRSDQAFREAVSRYSYARDAQQGLRESRRIEDPDWNPSLREKPIESAIARAKERYGDYKTASEEEFFGRFWPRILRWVGGGVNAWRTDNGTRVVNDENVRIAARKAMADMENWLKQNPKYVDYYSNDMGATLSILQKNYQGGVTEDDFMFFRLAAGLTSPATSLPSNIGDAVELFELWMNKRNLDDIVMGVSPRRISEKNGKMVGGNIVVVQSPISLSGATGSGKARTMKIIEHLIKEKGGVVNAANFLKEGVTLSELQAFNREMGYRGPVADVNINQRGPIQNLVQMATGQRELIPRMFIFGKKVGAYTLNLTGDPRYNTIDVWESRMIRSYFNGLFKERTGLPETVEEDELFQRFTELFKEEYERATNRQWDTSALQAMRWFYILNASKEAGYLGASTNETISEYTRRSTESPRKENYVRGGPRLTKAERRAAEEAARAEDAARLEARRRAAALTRRRAPIYGAMYNPDPKGKVIDAKAAMVYPTDPGLRESRAPIKLSDFAEYVDSGLNVEYPGVGESLFEYTQNGEMSGLQKALLSEEYPAYKRQLGFLLRNMFRDGIIPVSFIDPYAGYVDDGVSPLISVSINPTWGRASAKRGASVRRFNISIDDVVAAGNGEEGELIIKRPASGLARESRAPIPKEFLDEAVSEARKQASAMHPSALPLLNPEASPEALYAAQNPEAAQRFDSEDRARYSRTNSFRYSPEAEEVINRMTTSPPPNVTPGETILKALGVGKWREKVDRFRQGYISQYARLEWWNKNHPSLMHLTAGVSSVQAAFMADRSKAISAESMRSGIPVYKDGGYVVEKFVYKGKEYKNGLLDVMRPIYDDPSGQNHERLAQTYAIAKRGARLNSEGKLTPLKPGDFEVIQAEVNKFINPETGKPIIEEWHEMWQAYNNKIIDFLRATGVVDDAGAKMWQENSDYYPFYRIMEGEEDPLGARVFGGLTAVMKFKKLKGGEAAINTPMLEAITLNMDAAIAMGMKNVAQQRIARDMVNIGLGRFVAMPKELREALGVPDEEVGGDVGGKDVAHFKIAGKNVSVRIDDRLVYESMQAVPEFMDLEGTLGKLLQFPATALREMITREPGYMLANMSRDTVATPIVTGSNMIPVVDTVKHLWTGLNQLQKFGVVGGIDFARDPKDMVKFLAKSAHQLGFSTTTRETTNWEKFATSKVVSPIMRVWDGLGHISDMAEASTRAAVYEDTMKRTGGDWVQASWDALNVINYGRRGRNPVLRIVTAVVPFMNARIQGLDKLWEGASGQSGSAADRRKNIQKFVVRAGMMVALTAAYYSMIADDDVYDDENEEVKDNYYMIPLRRANLAEKDRGFYFKIPIPFEVGVLFKVIPERIMELMNGNDSWRDFRQSMGRALFSTLSMNPVPQAVLPLVEAGINKDFFTGRPVVPFFSQNLEPEAQSRFTTNELAKRLGEATGFSPLKIDHIMNGYLGSLGTYALSAIDASLRGADRQYPDRELWEFPPLRRFFTTAAKTGLQEGFYDLNSNLNGIVQSINKLKDQGRNDELIAMITEYNNILSVRNSVNSIDKHMTKYRDYREALLRMDIDPVEKRKMIDEIDIEMAMKLRIIQELRRVAYGEEREAG